ncbi:MAG: hypothetical protein JNL32_12600 [Candidatus Kapabacteria bacterium]|nr:hypothetical protein [Candidatus Kapabacteria bacterium]
MILNRTRSLRRILMLSSLACVVFCGIALVHIYMVVPADDGYVNSDIQLARIDFKQPLETEEFDRIEGFVRSQHGVTQTYFNKNDRILVYAFHNSQQNSADVFRALSQNTPFKAERFIPSQESMKNGCPVGGERSASLFRRTGKFLHKIFG